MRKDVKLGLAVGGVLLAVLVVYVLVVPGNQPGAQLSTGDGGEAYADGGEGGAGATGSAAPGTDAGSAGGNTSRQDQQAKANGGTSVDAGATRGGQGAGGASAGEKATADTGGSWNWDALVNGTEKVPSLVAQTQVQSNGATAVANSGATAGGNDHGAAGDAAGRTGSGDLIAQGPGTADPLSNATAAGSAQPRTRQGGTSAGAQPTILESSPSTRPSSGAGTHVVKVGETFSSIAATTYGSSKYYTHIEHANPSVDPTRLKPGTTITLPSLDDVKPAAATPAGAAAQQTIDPRTEYKVQPNDSLYTISIRLYGKADRVERIYELNKAAIGDDMARVKVGMVLKLPEPPTQATAAASTR